MSLRNAVLRKKVPFSSAERITDYLAGFVLARNTAGTETPRTRAWFRRAAEWLTGKPVSRRRRTLQMLFTDTSALINRELLRAGLGKKGAAEKMVELFPLISLNVQLESIERSLRRSSNKRSRRNK